LGLEKKEYTALVFCDFSKVFGRFWHKRLLLKLEKYGNNGIYLAWIKTTEQTEDIPLKLQIIFPMKNT